MDSEDESQRRPEEERIPNILGARLRDTNVLQPTLQRYDDYSSPPHADYIATATGATATTPVASSLVTPPPTMSIGPGGARSLLLGRVGKSSTTSRDFSDIPLDTGMNPQAVRREIKMLERKIKDLRARQPDISVERTENYTTNVKSLHGPHKFQSHAETASSTLPATSSNFPTPGDEQTLPDATPPPAPPAAAAPITDKPPATPNTGAIPKRSLPTIKLDQYDGSSPLQTHLSKLENCAKYYGWSSDDRLCHLKASLTGQAAEVLWQLTATEKEADVVRLLKNRFGSDHQMERYRLELQSRRRKPGETAQSVYNDIRRLLALSFPGQSGEMCELLGKDYFLTALGDPSLRVRVLDQSPKNLDEALACVTRMEAYTPSTTVIDGLQTDTGRGRVQEVEARDDKRLKQLEKELADHRHQIQQLKADNDFWRAQANQRPTVPPSTPPTWSPVVEDWSMSPPTPPSMPQQPPRTLRQPTDWAAGNHWNGQPATSYYSTSSATRPQFATAPTRGRPRGRGRGRPPVDRDTCRICLQRGHWSYECNSRPTIQGVSATGNDTFTYISVVLNAVKLSVLLDSGATCNLLPLRLVRNMQLEPCSMTLSAANGSDINVVGAINVEIAIQGVFFNVRFIVTDSLDTAILGYAWMCDNKCSWSFADRSLIVDGLKVPLISKPSDVVNVRRIYTREPVTIPVNHVVRTPIRMPACSAHTPQGDWVIGPAEIRPGLLLCRTLMGDSDEYPAIQLLNMSDKTHVLPSDLNLGLAVVGDDVAPLGPLHEVTGQPPSQPASTNTNGQCGTTVTDAAVNDEHLVCIYDSLPETLAADEREQVTNLLKKNADLFARNTYDIGKTSLLEATIDTDGRGPISEPSRRHAKTHLGLIDQTVDDLQNAGLIEPSTSAWASNLVIATKSDGKPRVTVDLRRLNAITVRQNFAMPHVSDSLDFLSQSKYLSVIDCSHSFFHIPLKESDREKTTFHTRKGMYQWTVLPQGATNSPAIFSRLMALTLRGLNYLCVLSFVDDLIVIGRSFAEHILNLELVLNRLRYANLKLKPAKCKLFQSEVSYLGFRVTGETIKTDPNKTACIESWQFPQNVSELRSLVGFLSYYRAFIRDFSARIEPLSQMLRKDVAIVATEKRLNAFQDLKSALVNAPILAIYRNDCPILIDVDTSSYSTGSVCQQYQDGELRVLEYASKCLSKSERNLCAYRRELIGLIFALKKFRPYLLGRKFTIRVDNMALQHMLTTKQPTAQLSRYLDFIADFDFTLEHRLGKHHQNCDALSRLRPCTEGVDGGPCRQCRKVITGEHVNAVETRRQARLKTMAPTPDIDLHKPVDSDEYTILKPLFAPFIETTRRTSPRNRNMCDKRRCDMCDNSNMKPLFAPILNEHSCVTTCVGNDDVSVTSDIVDDKCDKQSTDVCQDTATEPPVGRLGHTAPEAFQTLHLWDSAQLREAQLADPDISDVLKCLETNIRPSNRDLNSYSRALRALFLQFDSLVLVNGVLYRVYSNVDGGTQFYQVILPRSLKNNFLQLIHNDLCGHACAKKCQPQVQTRAWWHRWKFDVDLFVRCCDQCCSYYRGRPPKQGYLQPMVIADPAVRWSIDLSGPYPTSDNNKYILSAIDPFTKFAVTEAIPDKTAVTVARVIVNKIILVHGIFSEALTDGGLEFCNDLSHAIYRILGIDKLKTTARRPNTNGVCERLHRSFHGLLAKTVQKDHTNWSEMLPYVTFTYNITTHSATGFTPFYLMYGREARWTIDVLLPATQRQLTTLPRYAAEMCQNMTTAYHLVRSTLHKQANYMQRWYDRTVKKTEFHVGDKVRVYNDSVKPGLCPKWFHFYKDVGVITRKINSVTYIVSCDNWREDRVIHIDKLKRVEIFPE